MDQTIDAGALAAVVLTFVLAAVFALLSVMFYRGKWLNLISGNNLVTKEEMQQPYQRELGKRTSVCVGLFAVATVGPFLWGISELFGVGALRMVGAAILVVFGAGALGDVVYLSVWSIRRTSRDWRERLEEAESASPREKARAEKEVGLERRQAIVICLIVVAMLAFYLVIIPLAKSTQAS